MTCLQTCKWFLSRQRWSRTMAPYSVFRYWKVATSPIPTNGKVSCWWTSAWKSSALLWMEEHSNYSQNTAPISSLVAHQNWDAETAYLSWRHYLPCRRITTFPPMLHLLTLSRPTTQQITTCSLIYLNAMVPPPPVCLSNWTHIPRSCRCAEDQAGSGRITTVSRHPTRWQHGPCTISLPHVCIRGNTQSWIEMQGDWSLHSTISYRPVPYIWKGKTERKPSKRIPPARTLCGWNTLMTLCWWWCIHIQVVHWHDTWPCPFLPSLWLPWTWNAHWMRRDPLKNGMCLLPPPLLFWLPHALLACPEQRRDKQCNQLQQQQCSTHQWWTLRRDQGAIMPGTRRGPLRQPRGNANHFNWGWVRHLLPPLQVSWFFCLLQPLWWLWHQKACHRCHPIHGSAEECFKLPPPWQMEQIPSVPCNPHWPTLVGMWDLVDEKSPL